ncbi:MAG: DUF4142 domain-containing protein [Acidobacteria bacterium]|nr:DUF4142 domain-containing protein [Acidobacteriota bacterium]
MLSAVTGCGAEQPNKAGEQAGAATPPPATDRAAAATTANTGEADFVKEQLEVGEKQIGLARLVSDRATRPALKRFGETVLRDHQQATEALRQIAGRAGVQKTGQPEQLKVEGERLSKLSGAPFEREYLDEIIADHEDEVADLEKAANGNHPEIRQWATNTLPMVRRRLEEARELRKTGPTGGDASR